jgi:TonB-linked SusC/RagA family outer membrane protein
LTSVVLLSFIMLFAPSFVHSAMSTEYIVQQTAKGISINVKKMPLNKVISLIERQCDYVFGYNSNTQNIKKLVTANLEGASISQVLNTILSGTGLKYEISGRQILLYEQGQAPESKKTEKTSGTVTDENGQPMPGVSVSVKGTTIGTVTDANGNYSLDVPQGSRVELSFIGYKSTEVKAGSSVKLSLEPDNELLNEVVVIGYGTAKKSDLTGSVSSLNGNMLKDKSTPMLSNQLQGQMSGVQVTRSNGAPGAQSTIRIHGITTMSENSPLIIVDGIPVSSIDDVSPEDVENLQVLKDAASAAIYGSRAAAGVILITTKRAKNGNFAMTYNFEYGVDKATEKPSFGNAVEWMSGYNEMKYNDGAKSMFSAYAEDYINSYNENHAKDPLLYPDTNMMDLMFKKSTNHERHAFTISGGTDRLKTNFSFNYYNADALYYGKKYERFASRINNDYKIASWIHANVDLNLGYSHNTRPHAYDGWVTGKAMEFSPRYPIFFDDGTYSEGKDGDNPIAGLHLGGTINTKYYMLGGKVQLTLTPLDGLSITTVVSPNFTFYKEKNFQKKISGKKT